MASIPQGFGYNSLNVAADGRLRWSGKAADGQTLTGSTPLGPNGQAGLLQTLYKSMGTLSLLGTLIEARVLRPINDRAGDGPTPCSTPWPLNENNPPMRQLQHARERPVAALVVASSSDGAGRGSLAG